jgi:hypothetical protein
MALRASSFFILFQCPLFNGTPMDDSDRFFATAFIGSTRRGLQSKVTRRGAPWFRTAAGRFNHVLMRPVASDRSRIGTPQQAGPPAESRSWRLNVGPTPRQRSASRFTSSIASKSFFRRTRSWATLAACQARANSSFPKPRSLFPTGCTTRCCKSYASITTPAAGR